MPQISIPFIRTVVVFVTVHTAKLSFHTVGDNTIVALMLKNCVILLFSTTRNWLVNEINKPTYMKKLIIGYISQVIA